MSEYFTTIGLEIHAELRTKTKMFCDSANDPEEKRPNVNVCPICLGYPGTLPVINREAVKHVLRLGLAVGGKLADYTEFDRKNYFYPDIPKGYQISQYKFPLISGGELNGIKLTRVHLEEDTARSTHESGEYSLVDFNRAGVPLLELVTEPDIKSAEEASNFARELQLLLIYLKASDANMEKGEMRVEANISVSKDPKKFGTKVEVKNLNSFKAVEKAIRYEVERHTSLLKSGGEVIQETRGWDENREETFSQRAKEDSHDYRYFPDPDLPKLFVSEVDELSAEALRSSLPELPWRRRERLLGQYGIKASAAEIFVRESEWGRFFEDAVVGEPEIYELASNYLTSDLMSLLKETSGSPYESALSAQSFGELMLMISKGAISSRGAKDIMKIMVDKGGKPGEIAKAELLLQTNDENMLDSVARSIIDNPECAKAIGDYKNGNAASLQYLIGVGMKISKGSANPTKLREALEKALTN